MLRRVLVFAAWIFVGCNRAPESSGPLPDTSVLQAIRAIVAKQLEKKAGDVNPDLSFAAVGADDLDLVEITLEVEETFDIRIQDDALVAAAGATDADELCKRLTIRKFADVAASSPRQPRADKQSGVDGSLRESQVGTYGDLSKLQNPSGLVLVFVPSFQELVKISEDRLGRTMDEGEREALRRNAAVIALPAEKANEFLRKQSRDGADLKE